jgi:hypothetical protein
MTYLDEVARAIREAVPPDLMPDGDTAPLFRIYAVLALARGAEVTTEDVHDAWVAWMLERDPGHPSLRPFDELDEDVRRMDEPFAQAIRAVAATRGR